MIGFLFEIFTALICIGLILFFGVAFFFGFISEFLNLDKSKQPTGVVDTSNDAQRLRQEYELRKMNETLTRNRNDSLTRPDHYGDRNGS